MEAKGGGDVAGKAHWLAACADEKARWEAFKAERYGKETLIDEVWQKAVLTQPAAIKTVADFARAKGAAKFFDAGDVQANGFQIVEDEQTGIRSLSLVRRIWDFPFPLC